VLLITGAGAAEVEREGDAEVERAGGADHRISLD
jgi:hypothetical protein